MTRPPPHRAAIAAGAALAIAAMGLSHPKPLRIDAPETGRVAATWTPSFATIRLTVEIWP